MMEFFKKFFKNQMTELNTGEWAVKCPFPHTNDLGHAYFESVPSAHINERESLFHCKVCDQGMSEAKFLSTLQGISYKDSLVLLKELANKKDETFHEFRKNFLNSEIMQAEWTSLGLDLTTAETLHIGYDGEGISFPVFVYGELLDIRNYKPGRNPKVKSLPGAKSSLIYPFDLWVNDDRPTLLCAGEKDMSIARQMGFNAITFTGGEQAFPKLFKASFKGKKVYIAYDNDQAGQQGSRKVASMLKDCGAVPFVITAHYQVCTEKGEDIHDYFQKYNKNNEDLHKILDATVEFSEMEYREEQQKYIPLVTIEESTQGQYANKLVSSRVSVVATFEETFHVPEYVSMYKYDADDDCTIKQDTTIEWTLDEDNMKDILMLMDSNMKEKEVEGNLRGLMHISGKEKYLRKTVKSRMNIFKAVVTDDLETEVNNGDEKAVTAREMLIYSIGKKFEHGKKYRIYYKPVPHPFKGQQVVAIANRLDESDNSVNRFHMTSQVIDSLKVFQVKEGETIEEKMQELFERSKGIIGVEAQESITFATDLYFHTPLYFTFGKRVERAYLDCMIVGTERTGKSRAAKALLEWYQLGLITSLKTATIAGLLGGSDQVGGSWKTRLGLLPRNHKGAVVLEEFSGGGQDMISKLTEVRSSNVARITRVNGSVNVPCMVRMLSISNPKTRPDGTSIPLSSYPHGIQVLLELVGASEDIARYDFFLLVNEPDYYTSPLEEFELEPYEKAAYQNRIRWVWTRSAEQVHLETDVARYVVSEAEKLNKVYNSHIKFFGPEAWKKLARIAIATAGMLCSMDETGQKLIVTKDHVDWARAFLVSCYDNSTFKLREYVDLQKTYTECDDVAVGLLNGIFNINNIALRQLEMCTDIGRRQLEAVSGLDNREFNTFVSKMVKCAFIIPVGEKLQPTVRFRKAMQKVKSSYMKEVGEVLK